MNKRGKVLTRGSREGHCNICDVYGLLTEDHVPPKGTAKLRQVEMLHITDLLRVDRSGSSKRYMQSGMHFRTLCQRCNTELLGTKYDPELITLSNSVANHLKSALTLPELMSVRVRPGYIARAVIGHLMALGLDRRNKGTAGEAASRFFLDETESMPSNIDIYYWVYPYRRQIAIRDASMSVNYWKGFTVFWCLKYFPLGFLVMWDKEPTVVSRLRNLRDYMIGSGTAEVELQLALSSLPRQDFPEAPNDQNMVLYGDDAVGAISRSRLIA
jgi:hypothetical protein